MRPRLLLAVALGAVGLTSCSADDVIHRRPLHRGARGVPPGTVPGPSWPLDDRLRQPAEHAESRDHGPDHRAAGRGLPAPAGRGAARRHRPCDRRPTCMTSSGRRSRVFATTSGRRPAGTRELFTMIDGRPGGRAHPGVALLGPHPCRRRGAGEQGAIAAPGCRGGPVLLRHVGPALMAWEPADRTEPELGQKARVRRRGAIGEQGPIINGTVARVERTAVHIRTADSPRALRYARMDVEVLIR